MPWVANPTQSGIKTWTHVQTSLSTTWMIYHNMGSEPMVEVLAYDGGVLKKAFPKAIIHLDANNTQIEWTSPRSGQVNFVAP